MIRLNELVESIRQHGIIQPLVVRDVGGRHELIAGERRWRAAQEAGLTEVPVITRVATDLEVLEISLIENLQRADLNPIEEAQAYARLANEFGMRQEDIAQKVGRSRAAVANSMRLLDLHQQVQVWLTQGLLSVGHAKVLLALKEPEEQLLVAETILRRSATVRATERLVGAPARYHSARAANDRQATAPVTSATIDDLQNRLQEHLGTRVTLHHGEKRGASRSNITATMICNAFWLRSVCRRARRNMWGRSVDRGIRRSAICTHPIRRVASRAWPSWRLRLDANEDDSTTRSARKSGRNSLAKKRSRMFRQWSISGLGRPGSEAIEKTRNYLTKQLESSGWKVTRQAFTDDTPRGKIEFVNLIATFGGKG